MRPTEAFYDKPDTRTGILTVVQFEGLKDAYKKIKTDLFSLLNLDLLTYGSYAQQLFEEWLKKKKTDKFVYAFLPDDDTMEENLDIEQYICVSDQKWTEKEFLDINGKTHDFIFSKSPTLNMITPNGALFITAGKIF